MTNGVRDRLISQPKTTREVHRLDCGIEDSREELDEASHEFTELAALLQEGELEVGNVNQGHSVGV